MRGVEAEEIIHLMPLPQDNRHGLRLLERRNGVGQRRFHRHLQLHHPLLGEGGGKHEKREQQKGQVHHRRHVEAKRVLAGAGLFAGFWGGLVNGSHQQKGLRVRRLPAPRSRSAASSRYAPDAALPEIPHPARPQASVQRHVGRQRVGQGRGRLIVQ